MSYEKPVCLDFETGLSHSSDHVVCLWKLGEGGGAGNNIAMDTTPNEENWTATKILK